MLKAQTTAPARTPLAERYHEDGYCFPVDILSRDEAAHYRSQLETLEARIAGSRVGNKGQLNYPQVIFKFAAELVRHPALLDIVEQIIGPDILVWGGTFFTKEPHTDSYVSWHQDMRYWGLDDTDGQVSAWLALSPVTVANGCMRFVPGSHKGAMVEHNDTFANDNFLTRGQEAAVEINENDTVQVELAPGQASFHHGKLLHASAPNHSDERRIGFAINFIAPHVRQTVASQDFGILVRGEDRYGNFVHVPWPKEDLSKDALSWHNRILNSQNEAMYDGAEDAER
ncbi:MAG: phytanoyl-CoA dioxygenase family protein [Rhizobiales bacterium]|nr:phytanoyl-CoA dioxygenase family protein [Hyphomicrobiales bacterium]